MPTISSPNTTATITIDAGGNHYRFAGLEITTTSTVGCNPISVPPMNCYTYELIYPAMAITGPLNDSITVDRCYVHASPTIDVQHAIIANGSNFAVVDSYISDIHDLGTDSQAIGEWFSPGPIKIDNNYLSASTEDILLGGAGGLSNPYVASDVEVRFNQFYKPLSWAQPGVSLPPNPTMVVKDNFEIKSGQRVLLDKNTIQNVWVSGQEGYSIQLTPRPIAGGSLAVVDDVTISNNFFENVSSGFDILATDDNCTGSCTTPGEAKRVVFYNNVFQLGDTTQSGYTTGNAWGSIFLQGTTGITDFVLQHNTIVPPPNLGYCNASWYIDLKTPFTPPVSQTHNVWIVDNVMCRQVVGPAGYMGQFSYVIPDDIGDPSPISPRYVGNLQLQAAGDTNYQSALATGVGNSSNIVTNAAFSYTSAPNNYLITSPNGLTSCSGGVCTDDGLQWGVLGVVGESAVTYISPTSLMNGHQGSAYVPVAVTAAGGVPPYTCSLAAGSWPAGITLSACSISGTPTVSGTFSGIVINVMDSVGASTTSPTLSLTINASAMLTYISPLTLPNGTNGSPYSVSIVASGGTSPYTCTLQSGSLPAGISVSGCAVSGTPTVVGVFPGIVLKVTDSASASVSSPTLSLTIQPTAPTQLKVSGTVSMTKGVIK